MPLGDKPTGLHVQSKKSAVEKPCCSFHFRWVRVQTFNIVAVAIQRKVLLRTQKNPLCHHSGFYLNTDPS
jgi:hypothetical protein